jgi:hypothetical protein
MKCSGWYKLFFSEDKLCLCSGALSCIDISRVLQGILSSYRLNLVKCDKKKPKWATMVVISASRKTWPIHCFHCSRFKDRETNWIENQTVELHADICQVSSSKVWIPSGATLRFYISQLMCSSKQVTTGQVVDLVEYKGFWRWCSALRHSGLCPSSGI